MVHNGAQECGAQGIMNHRVSERACFAGFGKVFAADYKVLQNFMHVALGMISRMRDYRPFVSHGFVRLCLYRGTVGSYELLLGLNLRDYRIWLGVGGISQCIGVLRNIEAPT